jgi:catalase
MSTPEGALAFFKSIPNGTIGDFIQKNPSALRFVTIPKPTPNGFEHEQFWGVNAFKFIDAQGKGTFIRYRIAPDEGVETLNEEQLKSKSPTFLYEGVKERLTSGKPFSYKLLAQIAEEGDKTDDATVLWPDTRKIVTLGTIKIESVADHNAEEQKYLIWDPIPRVQGIEPSDDPLLDLRAGVYIIGGKDRRAAAVATEAAV